uniref:hypothetical protein n=1 Tax=Sphingomonas sp. TaxID=28214 RepID=UPI003561774D
MGLAPLAVIAAVRRTRRAPVERGWSSLPDRSLNMSLSVAQQFGLNMSRTMMSPIVVFRISETLFGVAEDREYDGDPAAIVRVFDPFER